MSEPSIPKTDLDSLTDPTMPPASVPSSWFDPPTTPVSLHEIDETGDCAPVAPSSFGQTLPSAAGRNLLECEIARGGIGAILKGRDPELNREVAVKVLLEAHRDKPEYVRRFLEEAQIGGQLQHPGTVPVYELGRFEDGRPFFSMKLVKGHTLAKLLARRADSHDDLQHFLTIFEQMCQTIAYSHARGVIHRDLKPANVMVGSFGEVQVMDWGMAKVVGREYTAIESIPLPAAEENSTIIHTIRSGSTTDVSRAGTVMGTPAYIPPEQAKGEVGAMDERTDVFGLGAILCTILTGEPPYRGGGLIDLMEKAWKGDLGDAFSRLDGCGADAELLQLCKDCLAADKEHRPRDASVLAQRMAAYQAGVRKRLRQAELDTAAAHTRAEEERKRQRLTAALAAMALGLVVVGAGGGLWLQRKQAELDQQRLDQGVETLRREEQRIREVEAALDKADGLRKDSQWAGARAVLKQALEQLGESGHENLRRRLEAELTDLKLVTRLDEIRLQRATFVDRSFDDRSADRDYAAAFRDAGLVREADGKEAVAVRVRESAIKVQLLAALDDWANVTKDSSRRELLLGAAKGADPDSVRDHFRDTKVWEDPAALKQLAEEAKANEKTVSELSPPLLAAVAKKLQTADAVPLLEAGQRRNPNDFWLNLQLANALLAARKSEEAVGYYRAALAARPATPVVYNNLANALRASNRLDEALREYYEAVRLTPGFAMARYNLGNALIEKAEQEKAQGRVKEAKARQEKAIQEYRTATDYNPRLSAAHTNLANVLRDLGRYEEAIASYRQAIDIAPRQVLGYNGLGNALRDAGRHDEAIRAYCASLHFNPKTVLSHTNLGFTLYEAGLLQQSVSAFERAIALEPKFAPARIGLGQSQLALERFDKTRDAARAGLEQVTADDPARGEFTKQLERCERLEKIKERLPALLRGEAPAADNTERLMLATFCQEEKRLYAAAVRFFADAFDADPKLADDSRQHHRYNAACAAAQAGNGKGLDVAKLSDEQRAQLRSQALAWLRADLARIEMQAVGDNAKALEAARQQLRHWQADGDLAGLRDRDAQVKMSETERDECRQFWVNVADLLKKAEERK